MSDVSLLVADDYLEKDYFLSEDYDGNTEGKTERKIKFIKVVFCILCFALLCELVIYKYIMPSFSSPKVRSERVFCRRNCKTSFANEFYKLV